MSPVLVQRVHPDPDRPGWYARFRVYPSMDGMRHAINAENPEHDTSETGASCFQYSAGPKVADLYFHAGELGAGLIAHEVTHAAIHWARRRDWLNGVAGDWWKDFDEEPFADIAGYLTRDFVSRLYRKGLLS